MRIAKLMTVIAALGLPGAAWAQVQCNLNWSDVKQRIDGFGASSAWRNSWSDAQADMFFSTNTGIGLSLLRSKIAYQSSTAATATPTSVEISIMQKARDRGALVWSAPWTPAAGFKSSNAENGGNYRGSGANATNLAYASQLANYVALMKNTYGVTLYALSVQNEPDFNTTGYESCVWNGQQIHDFVTNLYAALNAKGVGSTRIVIPESEHWSSDTALYTPTLDDPNAASMVSIVADHNYDNCPPSGTPSALAPPGKSLWETEVSKLMCAGAFDGSISDGLYWAGRIHLFLTSAQLNAWHYWWLISNNADNEGLTDQSGNPAKRMYVLGQWSRFVRPGYYRFGVNANDPNFLNSAFKDPNTGMFAVVAANPNNYATNEIFYLVGFTANSVTPWITSGTLSLASQSAVTVSGGSFSYTLPAQSVVTFVGQGLSNVPPTDITLSSSAVPEGQPPLTPVGAFSTADPNNGDTFSYDLVTGTGDTDNDSFSISSNVLETAATFDFLAQTNYSIRVRSTDQGGLWVEKPLTISVLAVPTDISLSAATTLEGVPIGTSVGTFDTVDANLADTFSYALAPGAGGDDNASFSVSGNSLLTAAMLNYEAQSSYSIRVRSTTSANQSIEKVFTIDLIDVNVPPNMPTNVAPAAGSDDQPLSLTLQASAFSDPNLGDSQAASEWLVQRSTDNAVVFDSATDTADLTSIGVPAGLLDYVTAYSWQVRYQDNHGDWSGYSAPTSFSTVPPSLAVLRQSDSVVISWPTNAAGFALQYSTDLTSSDWLPVTPDPVVILDQNVVTNGLTNPASFFRLIKPE